MATDKDITAQLRVLVRDLQAAEEAASRLREDVLAIGTAVERAVAMAACVADRQAQRLAEVRTLVEDLSRA